MSRLRIGMTSDEAVLLLEAGKLHKIPGRPPERIGNNDYGMIVNWYLEEGTVTFARLGWPAPYQIIKIKEGEDGTASISKPDAVDTSG